MKLADLPVVRNAPLSSKLELIEELWAEISAKADSLPLPAWHLNAVEESAIEFEANPREGLPWSEVRGRILKKP